MTTRRHICFHYCIVIIIFPHLFWSLCPTVTWMLFWYLSSQQRERERNTGGCMYLPDTLLGFPAVNSKEQEIAEETFTMMIRSSAAHWNENCFLLSCTAELSSSDMIFLIDDFVSAGWQASIRPKSKPSWRLLISKCSSFCFDLWIG